VYYGKPVEIDLSVKKDGTPITSFGEVDFNLTMNGQPQSITRYYDPVKGWVITFTAPNTSDTYSVELKTTVTLPTYSTASITNSFTIKVEQPVQFDILSVDRTEVQPNDVVTVNVKALKENAIIPLSKQHLTIQVGSTDIDSSSINVSTSGDTFNIKIPMPSLSPGSYDLKITLNYDGYSISKTRSVGYVIPVSGEIVDASGKGISVEMKFFSGNVEKKKFTTDSSGSYSGYILPGIYTLQLNFPQSTLYLYDADISSFDDPIKYYTLSNDIDGLRNAGLFVYEMALSFSDAKIVMNYDEKKVSDEKSIMVYKCEIWNSGKGSCDTNWENITADVDTIRNTVTLYTKKLFTYVIGSKKGLYANFNLNKNTFNLKELIKIRGITQDENRNTVANATVKASIKDTDISASTQSDSSGIFDLELLPPINEGNYSLLVSVEKSQYTSFSKAVNIEVVRSKDVSLVLPDTIKIKQGETRSIDFSIVNIGQADLSNLSLTLTGLPNDYFEMADSIKELKVKEEVKIPVVFKIPQNTSEATLSLTFKVSFDGASKEQILGFTIMSGTNVTTQPTIGLPTASIVLPSMTDISYAIIFGIVCLSVAYLLKKRKFKMSTEREEIKNLLSDIKREIRKKSQSF
jgi:hypothetical protein